MSDKGSPWPATIVTVAFVGLVALVIWVNRPEVKNTDDPAWIWAGVGMLAGAAAAFVPPMDYFKRNAAEAGQEADRAQDELALQKGRTAEARDRESSARSERDSVIQGARELVDELCQAQVRSTEDGDLAQVAVDWDRVEALVERLQDLVEPTPQG